MERPINPEEKRKVDEIIRQSLKPENIIMEEDTQDDLEKTISRYIAEYNPDNDNKEIDFILKEELAKNPELKRELMKKLEEDINDLKEILDSRPDTDPEAEKRLENRKTVLEFLNSI